jgi:rhodanese-related sulfurtransferase
MKPMHRPFLQTALFAAALVFAAGTLAVEIKIDENLPFVDVQHEGQAVRVQRIQDEENVLSGGFAKTSRKCPPFCIHPMQAAPGVTTVGELELLAFVKSHVEKGTGLLIDARTPEWYTKGTIPASVNIPFTVFGKPANDPEFLAAVEKLGVKPKSPSFIEKLLFSLKRMLGKDVNENALHWDFHKAKDILLWCNGPWCDQSPRAIKGLLKIGYPAEKMRYYRGGMQLWQILGLTVVVPGAEVAPAAK